MGGREDKLFPFAGYGRNISERNISERIITYRHHDVSWEKADEQTIDRENNSSCHGGCDGAERLRVF